MVEEIKSGWSIMYEINAYRHHEKLLEVIRDPTIKYRTKSFKVRTRSKQRKLIKK